MPPWKESIDAMLMILPLPWPSMTRPAAWHRWKTASRLTASTSSQSAAG